MKDYELLDLAAKAHGYVMDTDDEFNVDAGLHMGCDGVFYMVVVDVWETWAPGGWSPWNPLNDDGDALRLAAKLKIDILYRVTDGPSVSAVAPGGRPAKEIFSDHNGDVLSATRRSIVRAAINSIAHTYD